MVIRLVALAMIAGLCGAQAQAQEPKQSFAAFKAALWPDAQAKGVTRATFDLALKGVTPDQRVIAATKRQPEYGKPVGDYVNASPHAAHSRRPTQSQGLGEDASTRLKRIRRRARGADRAVGD